MFNRYGQWGIGLIAFRLGPGVVESKLLERINQHNLDAYSQLKKNADLRGDTKPIPRPRIWTREQVGEREWAEFLDQRGIGVAFIYSKSGLGLGDAGKEGAVEEGWTYPFRVEVLSGVVSGILKSEQARPNVKF